MMRSKRQDSLSGAVQCGQSQTTATGCWGKQHPSKRPPPRLCSDDRSSGETVRVAIRMRPLSPESDRCAGRAWRIPPNRTNAIAEVCSGAENDRGRATPGRTSFATPCRKMGYATPCRKSFATPSRTLRGGAADSEFVYDKVFGEEADTREVYNSFVSDLVESLTEGGINATVFTYGQTCSGKTFTMQGCEGGVGIIHLAAKDIFKFIEDCDSNSECSVRVSYFEVYNEELHDLLNDNDRKSSTSLIIREDKNGSIAVDGLREVAVKNLDQIMKIFKDGEKNKAVGSAKMNDRSSRSHSILKIAFERKVVSSTAFDAEDKENFAAPNSRSNDVVKTTSVLNLVDLAGSESVRHTGASGMQKKEGGTINQR